MERFAREGRRKIYLLTCVVLLSWVTVHAQSAGEVVRLDPLLATIVPAGAKLEKVAGGFGFLEGPVWVRSDQGYLLFSDIPANAINKWTPDGKISVFLKPSGFTGTDPSGVGVRFNNGHTMVALIGSNGITLDSQGRVVFCAHGDRAVLRVEKDGRRTVLAARYNGKRLDSPNDLVYKSDGALYFTDIPAGLRGFNDDPQKELPFNGLYLLKDGKLQLLDGTLGLPNGLAFAPGENYLYVDDSAKNVIMRFEVQRDDSIGKGKIFIDMSVDKTPGQVDGMKVDEKGDVYCTGPGGLWIMSPEGKHLGTLRTRELPANLAFGDADGKTLYITARTSLYRIRLSVPGIRP